MHDIDFYNESHEHKFHDRGVDFEKLRNLDSQPAVLHFRSMQDELSLTFFLIRQGTPSTDARYGYRIFLSGKSKFIHIIAIGTITADSKTIDRPVIIHIRESYERRIS